MLSYQHQYHAGNLADVHKHSLLAWMLNYLIRKPKPLTYIETHAGRALYDLASDEAQKTGEAAQGIAQVARWFADDHPYSRALAQTRADHGPNAYPGSPLLAGLTLRFEDTLKLAELHPQEHAALAATIAPYPAATKQDDGFAMALSWTPPDPRRGILLCDPSFEVKSDYQTIPDFFAKLHRRWPVGILVLWYPILTDNRHAPMLRALQNSNPDALRHEVQFSPARPGHGMVGSGLFVINPPYGLDAAAASLTKSFATLSN